MYKILIIEILLSGVLGAILFRFIWALTRSKAGSWTGVLIAAVIIIVFVPGHVDENLIVEYGGKLPISRELKPLYGQSSALPGTSCWCMAGIYGGCCKKKNWS